MLATLSLAFVSNITIETTYMDMWPPMLALGFAIGLVLTPMNLVAINAVPVRQHGEATGILTTVIGIGSVMGVAVTAGVFRTLEDNQFDRILKQTGHRIPDSAQRVLEGILTHAEDSEAELAKYPALVRRDIVGGVRLAFVYAISNALWVAVGVAALGVIVTVVALRGAKSPPRAHLLAEARVEDPRAEQDVAHHRVVLVEEDVAVEDRFALELAVALPDQDRPCSPVLLAGDADDVLEAVDRHSVAVDPLHEEVIGMDVERVILGGRVA